MIVVYWISLHDDIKTRGYWDQAFIEDVLANKVWETGYQFEHHTITKDDPLPGDGGIIVIPARHHKDDIAKLNKMVQPWTWRLAILTGDEANEFDPSQLNANRIWVMTPNPDLRLPETFRPLSSGYTPETGEQLPAAAPTKRDAWFFAGQTNHKRRQDMVDNLPDYNGMLVETEGFTEGLPPEEYFEHMAEAKIVPCPAGPVSTDNFRLHEALEAGCVPIGDDNAAGHGQGFWDLVFGERPPFPMVKEWDELPDVLAKTLADWPYIANRSSQFWQWHKRRTALRLRDDIQQLSKQTPVSQPITVLVATSFIPSHPDTAIIEETIDSIKQQLPRSEVFVMFDGLRPEQKQHEAVYDEYKRRVLWFTNHRWRNVLPIMFGRHLHQAAMTRQTLRYVTSPTICFVEHDTPVYGDVPWRKFTEVIGSGKANLIRLSHESKVLPPHRHLMLERKPKLIDGVPLLRTVQWSQRPHVASVDFYQRILDTYFGKKARTMIEDVMHGIVASAWTDHGVPGWQKYRLWLYAPHGDMKRSWHTDGRKDAKKGSQVFAYDGPAPPGAPQPGIRYD